MPPAEPCLSRCGGGVQKREIRRDSSVNQFLFSIRTGGYFHQTRMVGFTPMSDDNFQRKHDPEAPSPRQDNEPFSARRNRVRVAHSSEAAEAYNGWLKRMAGGVRRRSGLHGSLYTVQGYKNWAAKIKRDWAVED